MTTFTDATGDLLEATADALVNTVNTVGVMGKGIALQFKHAYPSMFKDYAQACKRGEVRLGEMWVFDAGQVTHPRWIVNFPTKGHWRSNSRILDIETGLEDLRRTIRELAVTSIAVPPLGCGNGGLDWDIVRPLIEQGLAGLDTEVLLYVPAVGRMDADSASGRTPFAQLRREVESRAGAAERLRAKREETLEELAAFDEASKPDSASDDDRRVR